jgi:glycosyltransferase involved in cell wall biosynthesis
MTTILQTRTDSWRATTTGAVRRQSAPLKPVRVCFLIDELTTAGTETQLLALIRNLDRRRVTPYLCLLRGQTERSRTLEPVECPVLRLGIGSLARPGSLVKSWRLVRFLREQQIDIMQVYFPDSTYIGVPAAWLARVPRIVRTRNNLGYWMTPWHRRLGRICNRLADVLVANCEASRNAVLRDEELAAERVVVLENGVDLDRFPPTTRKTGKGPRRVGVIANLRPIKGLDNFIRAASILASSHPDVTFHVAGEGPLRADLSRLATECGLQSRFVFEGALTDVPKFLANVDVAVLPSRSEGMSNALLEYMAAAKPIVATAVGGNPQLIDDEVHGLLVPPDDPAKLADAIRRLLDNTELAERLGGAARRRVEERYCREAMVRRFEDFYERLMHKHQMSKDLGIGILEPCR